MGNIRSKCKKTAKISFILSLIISLLMLVLLSTGENEISSIIFAFIFTLITVFIIIFTIIFCIHLMIYGLSILKESKAYNQYFKKLKDVIEKIRKKNVKLCQKCNKELGGFFTGKWRSVKGEKYCLDCAHKKEHEAQKSSVAESKKEKLKEEEYDPNNRCNKCECDLGGFFTGSWGYFHGKSYCKKCLTKLRADADTHLLAQKEGRQRKRGSIEEIRCTCMQCGHVWHYLPREKESANCQSTLNACVGCASCGSFLGFYSMNKAHDYQKHAQSFDKCPKCGSRNFKKERHYYDKE